MRLFLQINPSLRWRMILLLELEKIGLSYTVAELEEHDLTEIGPGEKYGILLRTTQLYNKLEKGEKRAVLLDTLKGTIIKLIRSDDIPKTDLSAYLSNNLNYNYVYLSNLFSMVHGYTLSKFIIEQKIERAKELLINDHHTLSEISWMLRYSSEAHLSNQFKKITGFTPMQFKLNEAHRCK